MMLERGQNTSPCPFGESIEPCDDDNLLEHIESIDTEQLLQSSSSQKPSPSFVDLCDEMTQRRYLHGKYPPTEDSREFVVRTAAMMAQRLKQVNYVSRVARLAKGMFIPTCELYSHYLSRLPWDLDGDVDWPLRIKSRLSIEQLEIKCVSLMVARVRTLPPLTSLRAEYEAKRGMDMRSNQAHMAQQMAYNPNVRYPGAGAPHMQQLRPPPGYQARQVETLQMQQEMAARGGTTMSGAMAPSPQPHRLPVHQLQQLQQPHTLPVLTRAPLSTMGSLQSIAAMAGGGGEGSTSSSSNSNSPAPAAGSHCNHCASTLLTQRDVFIHSLHTPESGAFVCSVCPVAIKDERSAIKHIVNHMEQNERRIDMDMECPFPECQVEIPTLIVLKAHLVAHNPPLRHRVKGCHISFGSAALAAAHAEFHNKSDRTNECCVLCGTMDNFESEMTVRRGLGHTVKHVMKHAMTHKYYCKICDMKTFDKARFFIN
ncbi:hypothetical protein PRIPAC_96972 [Pristionchus pacificus]|uniref:C2H2-type domain-containing protein n=1 Tax=Pristionchus pacificus TaxID=54126 RepID=A0A2A6CH51_PRIPA|nr:hypothetical protein PRIPAC_96972 [Pristionchus pacificus]|eukprot:PDM77393.1 hypothetical protein PRIPAC_33123 [Pristionchus pacificus]